MKIRSKRQVEKANKVFTDRKEPRKSFWDRYNQFEDQMNGEGDISVLAYYGIGGIGKTTLLKKLIEELKEHNPKAQYIYYDFDISQNSRNVLQSMKRVMEEKYKFYFPLFDIAMYVYANKIGEKIDSPQVKSYVDNSPFLNAIVTAAGAIPLFSLASQLILAADRGFAFVRNFVGNHKHELAEIEYKDAVDIYKSLPLYFAMDLADNLEKSEHPFVFFFDTYEQLVNELSSVGEPLLNDEWIRGVDGLIQNTPNAIWVIAGREKLKWEKFDAAWSEALEQHILGGLSDTDALSFLSTAGVEPHALREEIYDLTKGIPVYLDICVERYTSMIADGKTPEIADFGNNEHALIERFVRYMDDSKKDIVYVLSYLNFWTDDMIQAIGGNIVASFSLTSYEKVKEFSFINQDNDGIYSIHKIVGETLVKSCPDVIKAATIKEAMKFCSNIVESLDIFDAKWFFYFKWLSSCAITNYDDAQLLEIFRETIYVYVKKLLKRGLYKEVELIYNPILDRVATDDTTELYAAVTCGYARVLLGMSKIKEAILYGEKAMKLYKELYDDNDDRYLKALLIYGRCLFMDGQYDESLKIAKFVMERRFEKYGYENEETLIAMSAVGNNLQEIGEYQKTLELREKIYEYRSRILGQKHPSTIETMDNIGRALYSLGRYTEALPWRNKVVDLRKQILGERHIETCRTITGLGNLYYELGDYNRALSIIEANYENMVNTFGENNIYVLRAFNNYGVILKTLGRYNEALKVFNKLINKFKELLGDEHPYTLKVLSNYGGILKSLGHYEECLKVYKQVFKKCKEILGENHPDTVDALASNGSVLYSLGRYEECLKVREDVLNKRKEILGENHPDTVSALHSCAWGCFLCGMSENGLEYIKECIKKSKEIKISSHSMIVYRDTLALIYADTGHIDEAIKISLENLEKAKSVYPDNKLKLSNRLFTCAYGFNAKGDKEKALYYALKSKELREECYMKDETGTLLQKLLQQLQVSA